MGLVNPLLSRPREHRGPHHFRTAVAARRLVLWAGLHWRLRREKRQLARVKKPDLLRQRLFGDLARDFVADVGLEVVRGRRHTLPAHFVEVLAHRILRLLRAVVPLALLRCASAVLLGHYQLLAKSYLVLLQFGYRVRVRIEVVLQRRYIELCRL